ncbi:MAG: DUF4367 domain-containing protein [Lachnospiraceae bacterium]|nr:DUF4367 domain-containing protein [Lachnospiraceae bacterium]
MTTTQKKRKKRQKRILSKVWKSVAAVFIVISAGFLLAFTTNAEFRGKVINWYLTTFRQNSVVQPETDDAVTMEHLREYRPSYMPERYRLVETLEAERWIVYGYQDDEAKMLDITLQIPGVISSIDTQGLEMKTLLFHDEIAYLVTGGEGYGTFVFSVDGIPVLIDGYASPEEMLQIAEGIGN